MAALSLASVAVPAAAQEYCVACTEPAAIYRCVIDGARPGATSSLQLNCLSTLAKEGAHATCAVQRGVTVLDCNGPVKHVAIPAAAPAETGAATPIAPSAPAKVEAADGPPTTVAEMLRRAKEKSDRDWEKTSQQIKSGNDKVGGFFKKSWGCLSSLFSRCE